MSSYLIEVVQQQRVMVRIEAHFPAEALDRVSGQQGQLDCDQKPLEVMPEWTRIMCGE